MAASRISPHQYWSCDVRYVEEHLLPDPKPVYVISIFENFSRMVLSSKLSATQNQWDYLSVLINAIRRYGAPEAIVTDGGGIFTSNMATELYALLDIRKERIEPGAPWQNYAETLLYVIWNLTARENCQITYIMWTWNDQREGQFHIISIQRRLADHDLSNARTWQEMQRAHRKWWTNYNREHHQAHQKRQDGRHSPQDVLRGVLGRTYPEEVLSRVLYATQFTRQLDRHGYARFKNWRFFGEDGLAGEEVSVWMYEGTLKIEYQTTTLSEYNLRFSPNHQQIQRVSNSRRIETHFVSPQLHLWQRSETEWLLALRQPERNIRTIKRVPSKIVQLRFPEMESWWAEVAF
jgi:putative transposase